MILYEKEIFEELENSQPIQDWPISSHPHQQRKMIKFMFDPQCVAGAAPTYEKEK